MCLPQDALQFSDTFNRFGGVEGYTQALEIGATQLPLDRWVQVRTPAFKAEYGDWETLNYQKKIDSFIERAIASHDPREALEFRQVSEHEIQQIRKELGVDATGFVHEFVAHEFKHAFNRHHADSFNEKNQRSLTLMDLKRIPVVLDGYDHLRIKPAGQNRSSLIYSKAFSGGRIEYVERVLETSSRQKPRLSTKTVWVKSPTGATSSPPQVYTPERSNEILPFSNGRINPADIAATLNPINGILGWVKPDRVEAIQVKGLPRVFAPMTFDNSMYLAETTVKLLDEKYGGNRIYTVEAINVFDRHQIIEKFIEDTKKAGNTYPITMAETDKSNPYPNSLRSLGVSRVINLAENIIAFNSKNLSQHLNPYTFEPTRDFLARTLPSPLIDLNGLGNREAARKLHDSVSGDIAHLPLVMLSAQAAGKQIDAQALIKAADLHPIPRKDAWLSAVRSLPEQSNTRTRHQDKGINR